jgi:hypothetical protein
MGIVLEVISGSDAGKISTLKTIHDIRQTPNPLLYDDNRKPRRGYDRLKQEMIHTQSRCLENALFLKTIRYWLAFAQRYFQKGITYSR